MVKAVLSLALVAGASATFTNCAIPAQYATSNGANCAGPTTGYNIWGICVSGFEPGNLVTAQARVAMDANNLAAFSSNAAVDAAGAVGCVVPAPYADWETTDPTVVQQTQAGLVADGGNCLGYGGNVPVAMQPALGGDHDLQGAVLAANGNFKGIEVHCDEANNFFPTNGFEGSAICQGSGPVQDVAAANDIIPAPTIANAYWQSAPYQALNTGITGLAAQQAAAHVVAFSGDNALQCTEACTLPAEICTNGVNQANIALSGNGILPACRVLPTRANVFPATITFACKSAAATPTIFTATCNRDSTAALTTTGTLVISPTYTDQCGTADGAQSNPRVIQENNDLPLAGVTEAIPLATEVEGFAEANGVLSAYAVTNAADNANIYVNRRSWNNNPAQAFQAGVIYTIVVNGCTTQTTVANRNACVQRTLNFIRCERDFPFQGATCYANNILIPCPNHELGFRCPSSSKKGLLGLLGLLGIPLLCLPLCCLLLCCIRRKKTEPDVHFATFDPLGAPAQPMATAVPTAFGATPFATAPSAVPVL